MLDPLPYVHVTWNDVLYISLSGPMKDGDTHDSTKFGLIIGCVVGGVVVVIVAVLLVLRCRCRKRPREGNFKPVRNFME